MNGNLEFVGLGEALIDLFEGGAFSLGGAPLNVAVHAHHLLEPLKLGRGIVVSAVGDDKWGAYARSVLAENSMTTEYVATNEHATGTANVFVRDGEPGFEITQNVAWDYLQGSAATDALADRCDAVCFGSLAQRSDASRKMIRAFLTRASHAWRLYDVNFRRSTLSGIRGYSREIVESSCRLSSAMKANEHEMIELGKMFEVRGANGTDESAMWHRMEFFLKKFGLEAVIVTRAERGPLVVTPDEHIGMPLAESFAGEIHPVGAGDAFSAGILFGRAQGWPWRATLELATKMGSWVTRHISAIPRLPPEILELASEQMKQYPRNDNQGRRD
jgi:fructokinase